MAIFRYKWSQRDVLVHCELDQFDDHLPEILAALDFDEVKAKTSSEESEEAPKELDPQNLARALKIMPASAKVAIQLGVASTEDRYGLESIMPRGGYSIYRFKGLGMMVHSYAVGTWELGVLPQFGAKDQATSTKIIIQRFLGMALAPLGLIGLWGRFHRESFELLAADKAQGEAIVIDVLQSKIVGGEKAPAPLVFERLDPTQKMAKRKMAAEELISFLSRYTTFFNYRGPSVPVRQMLQELTTFCEGYVVSQKTTSSESDLAA